MQMVVCPFRGACVAEQERDITSGDGPATPRAQCEDACMDRGRPARRPDNSRASSVLRCVCGGGDRDAHRGGSSATGRPADRYGNDAGYSWILRVDEEESSLTVPTVPDPLLTLPAVSGGLLEGDRIHVEARVDGLRLQREHGEHRLMHLPQLLVLDEGGQRLDAKAMLPAGELPPLAQVSLAEYVE